MAAGLPAHAADTPGPRITLAAGSPAADALLTQPIGADAAAAWHWVPVLAAVRRQGRGEAAAHAAALRRGLLALVLAQSAGEPVPANATIASVIAAGRAQLPIDADTLARQRWAATLLQRLVPAWPDGPMPLPPELDLVAARTTELAPGLWASTLSSGAARSATWSLRLRVTGSGPLAPGDLVLQLARGPRAAPIVFECTRPRGVGREVLQPGQQLEVVCRSQQPLGADRADWGEALDRLRARDAAVVLAIDSTDLRSIADAERMMAALAAAVPSPVPAFAARHADCTARGGCTAAAGAEPPPAPQHAPAERSHALLAIQLLLGFSAYMMVARLIGAGRASSLLATGLIIASVAVGGRTGTVSLGPLPTFSASWIAIPVLLAGSLVVVALCHAGYRAYARLFFRDRG